jgi:hypothetical protein
MARNIKRLSEPIIFMKVYRDKENIRALYHRQFMFQTSGFRDN